MLLAGKLRTRSRIEANVGIAFARRNELETAHMHCPHLRDKLFLVNGRDRSVPPVQFKRSAPHLEARVFRLEHHMVLCQDNDVALESWESRGIATLSRGLGKDATTYLTATEASDIMVALRRRWPEVRDETPIRIILGPLSDMSQLRQHHFTKPHPCDLSA